MNGDNPTPFVAPDTWRQAILFALTCFSAVAFILVVGRLLRGVAIPPGVGFWAVLVLIVGSSFAVFYLFLWNSSSQRGRILTRVLKSFGLAVVAYFVAINIAFVVATLLFGA